MKQVCAAFVLILFATLALAQTKPDSQQQADAKPDSSLADWILVGKTPSNVHYRNSKRLSKTTQGTVLSWEKNVPRMDTKAGEEVRQKAIESLRENVGEEKADSYNYNVALREYDCGEQKNRYLGMWFYDKDGKLIYQLPKPSGQWGYSPPNSIGEVTMKAACEAVTKITAP